MRYAISPRVAHQIIGGEAVIVDLGGARMLGLNAVGSLVWSRLRDHDEEAIVREVQTTFDVDLEVARADVRAFLGELIERGFVTRVP